MNMNDQKPLPDTITIPATLVDRWLALPTGQRIGEGLTKQDWDNLFFALDHTIFATNDVQMALVAYSNNDVAKADSHVWDAARRAVEAQNRLRQFMTGIMASVK